MSKYPQQAYARLLNYTNQVVDTANCQRPRPGVVYRYYDESYIKISKLCCMHKSPLTNVVQGVEPAVGFFPSHRSGA